MKKVTLFSATVLAVWFLTGSCVKQEKESAFDLVTAKKEIEEVNRHFKELFAKGDSAGIAELYTQDAKFMDAGAPAIVGRSAIRSVMSKFIGAGLTSIDFQTIDIFGSEALIAEEGNIKLYINDAEVGDSKYIVLWKKEEGKWKLFRDISNSNHPEAGSK